MSIIPTSFHFTRIQLFGLIVLGGILSTIAFPFTGSITPLVFVMWIPLLLVDRQLSAEKKRGANFLYTYLYFYLFNLGTTWWIWNASDFGSLLAFALNALLMCLFFRLFSWSKDKLSPTWQFISFVAMWTTFEFLHLNWELSWPWLNLGNYFSIRPQFVQFYEFTGVLGGTIWVLAINYLIYQGLSSSISGKKKFRTAALVLLIPSVFSVIRYFSYSETLDPVHILVTQPNIDPYNEKFDSPISFQIDKLTKLIDRNIQANTELILAPETALAQGFDEDEFYHTESYYLLQKAQAHWSQAELYIGASTIRFFDEKFSPASRKLMSDDGYYESYNTSLLLDSASKAHFVHKSRLVLGVEKLPFIAYLPFLNEMSIDLGGSSGTLGIEKEPKIFHSKNTPFAPIICYESVYGDFVAGQVDKGAEVLCVITNDGWWGDTPGYKQHFSFSQLRAIETRRSVARSANTGYSGAINQRGDVLAKTEWWKEDAFNIRLNKNQSKTLYSILGDYLGYLSVLGAIVVLILSFRQRKISKPAADRD